jgi:hypothetical protein
MRMVFALAAAHLLLLKKSETLAWCEVRSA